MGPTSVAGSMGSPTLSAPMAATKASSKASATSWTTMNRLAAMQLCPLLMQRAWAAVLAAACTSASFKITKGSDPPSSRTVFLRTDPAAAATETPAGSLPVRVTAFTAGWRMMPSTAREPTRRVRKAPSGNPALRKISSMARAQPGTLEACLRRPTFPAMRAGAAKRKTCQKGKFQGMTARIGPRGS